MDISEQQVHDPNPHRSPPAPLGHRLAAFLFDNVAALLLLYSGLALLHLVQLHAAPWFVALYLFGYQMCVLCWALFKDAWWRGQGIGKKIGRILLVDHTNRPAGRLRCIWRQTIFILILLGLYLPFYLRFSLSPDLLKQMVLSSLLSVDAPLRLATILLPDSTQADRFSAHVLVLGFLLLEALLVYTRSDRRRIVDFLAGTQVADAKSTQT